jgi:hypothetical protein
MRRRNLRIDNFSLGLRRDSALVEDRMPSMRTLKNWEILYTDGRLRIRPGYTRWNGTELEATATQLFWFADLSGNEHLVGILDDAMHNGQWYKIAESGAHTRFDTQIATARQPIIQVKDRIFYGVDSGGATAAFMWADDTSLGAGAAYRVGIARPQTAHTITPTTATGHTHEGADTVYMDRTDQRKLAIQYDVGATDVEIESIHAWVQMPNVAFQAVDGGWDCKAFTNNGGEPSTTLADDNAVADYMKVGNFASSGDYKRWQFRGKFTLSANTTYFFVFEGDYNYYENADNAELIGYMGVEGVAAQTYGPMQEYDAGAGSWGVVGGGKEGIFYLGGIDTTKSYGYVITWLNSTYGIESRPSVEVRANMGLATDFTVSTPATADDQVDKVRIYRREMDDIEDTESDITDTYKFVGEVAEGASYVDYWSTEGLGAELQTQDHYLFDETDDDGDEIRTAALVPDVAVHWKGRVWFAEANDNVLHFSKKLEKDGRTGLTGDPIPDYFPLDNKLEIEEPSDIVGLLALSADELAIYFRNTSVWLLRGTDSVLNPPPDIVKRQVLTDIGLVAPAAVDSLRSRHVFLSRNGLYTFDGTTHREFLSSSVQSILDAIADANLDDSVLVTRGDSVWLAVDEDEDGSLENIYILDVQGERVSWRLYNYGVNIYDMVVRKTGTEYKTILASDADNKYILKLEDGTTDNGEAIVAEVEPQDLTARNLATIYEISIDAYYPNVPPVYEGEVTDGRGDTHPFELTPVSVDDIAGHKAYPLITSPIGARVKITQRSINQNELRAIDIGFMER